MKIGIIACTSSKLETKATAREMYQPSSLFHYADKYATAKYDKVFFLSSKYGLLEPTDEVEPYNVNIESFRDFELKEWSEKIVNQIRSKIDKGSELFLLIGEKYTDFINYFDEGEYVLNFPLEGVGGIGKQLQFFKGEVGSDETGND